MPCFVFACALNWCSRGAEHFKTHVCLERMLNNTYVLGYFERALQPFHAEFEVLCMLFRM